MHLIKVNVLEIPPNGLKECIMIHSPGFWNTRLKAALKLGPQLAYVGFSFFSVISRSLRSHLLSAYSYKGNPN